MDSPTETPDNRADSDYDQEIVNHSIRILDQRLAALESKLAEVHEAVLDQRTQKEWYTTAELAQMKGVSQYTVQERWCNQGRIASEKDPATGKWRIPGREYRRLMNGGGLLPRVK